MQKKLTVLFAFATFVLIVGWAITPAQAHCQGVHSGDHRHCQDEVAEYSVMISGAVSGSGTSWQECNTRGGKCIRGVDAQGDLTLSFFTGPDSPFSEGRGENCFTNSELSLSPQARIQQGRGGSRADGHFWFEGWTYDNLVNEPVQVLYVLNVFGNFLPGSDDLPPSDDETTSMEMTHWEIRVENEGHVITNISCIDEGTFNDGDLMFIDVTRN